MYPVVELWLKLQMIYTSSGRRCLKKNRSDEHE